MLHINKEVFKEYVRHLVRNN